MRPLRLPIRTLRTYTSIASSHRTPSKPRLNSSSPSPQHQQQQQQQHLRTTTVPTRTMATTTSSSQPSSSSLNLSIPPNAWDSHMHVVDPQNFPPAASATYTPHAALLKDAQQHARSIAVPNLVFVQPSTYGFDNACLLSALKTVGPKKGRGVVVVDVDALQAQTEGGGREQGTGEGGKEGRGKERQGGGKQSGPVEGQALTLSTLRTWHTLGVRGLRINLKSVGRVLTPAELAAVLTRHADAIRPLGTWALQIYADLPTLRGLADLMPRLGVKVVVDHLGSPGEEIFGDEEARRKDEGWREFVRFLGCEGAYTKVSGPYRFSRDPEYRDLEGVVKEVLAVRGGRAAVWASDWPHTRFEGLDITPWLQRCVEWCGNDEELKNNLFRDNAHALWDVD